ncbi:hypothetical protein PMAYCL1PPCAC_29710 [Pristionchus mayeri]|uniref:Uncharacterized protein n=1 Tax=Pristionchus mayeri TaxID=1317129 RepID=A0AAN5DCA8_9BILA|nr:hypothetical protein PMAYCL1PPCAC_29710 [Pristionchus mayeri]
MRVSLISVSVVFVFFSSSLSLANASDWDDRLMFCARKALAVASQSKCRWMGPECYTKNAKYAANVSKLMCTSTFTMRKLGEFCCNESLDDLNDIVRSIEESNRRRRSHGKKISSSSNEFEEWISNYIQ